MKLLIWGEFPAKVVEEIPRILGNFSGNMWLQLSANTPSVLISNINLERTIRAQACDALALSTLTKQEDIVAIINGWSLCFDADNEINFNDWLSAVNGLAKSLVFLPPLLSNESILKSYSHFDNHKWKIVQKRIKTMLEVCLNSKSKTIVINSHPLLEQLCYWTGKSTIGVIEKIGFKFLPYELLHHNSKFISNKLFLQIVANNLNDSAHNMEWLQNIVADINMQAVKPLDVSFVDNIINAKWEKFRFVKCSWQSFCNSLGYNQDLFAKYSSLLAMFSILDKFSEK